MGIDILNIKTKHEWADYIDSIYVMYRPWHILDNRFEVNLPSDKVKGHEVEMQHWVATNFNYDIQCIIDTEPRDLTDNEINNITVNVTKKHLIKKVKKWGLIREVPNSPEAIERYVRNAITNSKRYVVNTFYLFYFLSEEDAMAFKVRWM